MQANVIYETNGNLRLRDFSLTKPVDLSEIDFYVGLAAKTQIQVFLILTNADNGIHEIVELKQTENMLGRPVFRIPLTYSLRFDTARVNMQLVIFDVDAQTSEISQSAKAYVSAEKYKVAREIAIVNELGKEVKVYYEAIIKALEDIVKKGEKTE